MTVSLGDRGIGGVVLDVEGTTTPVGYVYDVLFPYARAHLRDHVPEDVAVRMEALMDADSKDSELKALQGRIWERGYRDGALRGEVFASVPIVLGRWRSAGVRIAIYSSGSVLAQKLLFSTTKYGDLTRHIDHHFDTAVGPKRDAKSYKKIAKTIGLPPAALLFMSDVHAELDAARSAGMQALLVVRPGNAESAAPGEEFIADFGEIVL